jgi:CRISPR-associated protein Csm2
MDRYNNPDRRQDGLSKGQIELVLEMKDPKEFVRLAEEKAKTWAKNKNKISNSQLRNVFDNVKKIKDASSPELFLLKPKLTYIKERNSLPYDFIKTINSLIDGINGDNNRLKNFQTFFEALVAYNKEYGGK